MKILVEKYLERERKLLAAFNDFEKAYDKELTGRAYGILQVYGVGGNCLRGSSPSTLMQVLLCR